MRGFRAFVLTLVVGLGLIGGPAPATAQSFGWQAAAAMLIDPTPFGQTRVGPGLTSAVLYQPHRPLSYMLVMTVARTDFSVDSDRLHRNHGSLALGLRYSRGGRGPRIGMLMGLGMLAWDDVSEDDPSFRSGANARATLLPGVEASIPVTGSVRVGLTLRDHVTGWWNAILDPDEGDVRHRWVASIGLEVG